MRKISLILISVFLISFVSASVSVRTLDTPVVDQAYLTSGGTLTASTTYYYRIGAKFGGYGWGKGDIGSPPSIEGSFTTNSTHKSFFVNWTEIVGAESYNIYLTTTQGDYYRKRCASSGLNPTTNTNYFTITSVCSQQNPWDTFALANSDVLPNNVSKELGSIEMNITGGDYESMQEICDDVATAGYPEYCVCFYQTCILKGQFYIPSGTSGSLNIDNHILWIVQGSYYNDEDTLFDAEFGDLNSGGYAENGNQIWVGGYSYFSAKNTKVYNAIFKSGSMPIRAMLYPKGNGAINVEDDDKDIIIIDPNDVRDASSDMTFIGTGFSYQFTKEIYNFKHNGHAQTWYLYNPSFRNSYFNTGDYAIEVPNAFVEIVPIIYYDCDFKFEGIQTENNLPIIKYRDNAYRNATIYNSLNLKITDGTIPLENVNITLKDKNNNIAFTELTYANGTIDKQDVLRAIVYHNSSTGGYAEVNGVDLLSPFTLTMTKSGYSDYEYTFNFTKKIDWEIALNTNSGNYGLLRILSGNPDPLTIGKLIIEQGAGG